MLVQVCVLFLARFSFVCNPTYFSSMSDRSNTSLLVTLDCNSNETSLCSLSYRRFWMGKWGLDTSHED